jgi:glycosyltransferase involved in cell wall biosynthesis
MYKLAVLNTHPIQYFAPLYRRLAQEPDIDLTVYFCSHQGVEEYLDDGFGERIKWDVSLLEGYNYRFLNNLRRGDQVGGFWSLINLGIISELRRGRYDALLVNGHNHATYLIAMFASRLLGTSVLVRCDTHLLLRRSALKRWLRKPLMGLLYRGLCSFCLPIGTLNRQFYLSHGVSEDRLFLVPFAVDNEYFKLRAESTRPKAELKKELGLPQEKAVILFASKLISRKRPMDLLMAFQAARRRDLQAVLVFVGSGEQEKLLRDYVREHEIPDVLFFGFQNQSELPKFYSVADVFVLPSENEPWGLVLNEVMCAGLPVIASDEIGAVPDLVRHRENGFAFSSGNIAELCEYIHEIMNDAEMRKRMGEASRRIIEHWDYESCVAGIREVLLRNRPELGRLEERPAA